MRGENPCFTGGSAGAEYIILANVYAPNRDDPAFFVNLEGILYASGQYDIVLGRDMNLVFAWSE